MTQNKKILFALPDALLDDVDALAQMQNVSRSDLIRTAVAEYVKKEKQHRLREALKQGYQEMGQINLSLAEMGCTADTQALNACEEKLSECE